MTTKELGLILREMYDNSPRGEQVTFIHLFGIRYHQEIKNVGIREVVEMSGIAKTYRTEVNKGVNLGKYVIEKG